MSFSPPNHTQTPNELFANLPDTGEAELKVTLAIIRDTFGWGAPGAATVRSLTELMTLTGLSRQGVLNGLTAAMKRGTVYRTDGPKNKAAYGLSVHEVDRSTRLTGLRGRPELVNVVDRSGQPSRPKVVNPVDHSGATPPAPSARKTGAERQQTDSERKERQQQQTGEGRNTFTRAAAAGTPNLNEQTTTGEEHAGTPGGVRQANATTGHGNTPAEASDENGIAQVIEQVPGAGAALAALTAAVKPLKPMELMQEHPGREFWLYVPAERIRALHADLVAQHGSRKFRGALIDALDTEARKCRPASTTKTTKTSVQDEVRARLKGARP